MIDVIISSDQARMLTNQLGHSILTFVYSKILEHSLLKVDRAMDVERDLLLDIVILNSFIWCFHVNHHQYWIIKPKR